MDAIIHLLDSVVHISAQLGIKLIEIIGIAILLITAGQGVYNYFRHDEHVRLKLAQGIALALEFKLGGEVLHTVIAREMSELGILGAIILLRAALTVLLHWEIKNEEKNHENGGKAHLVDKK